MTLLSLLREVGLILKVEETKRKIVENSKKVFIEKGLKNVTMTDLVEVSGYSRGGVYRYFKKPEEVFIELMHHETRNLNQKLGTMTFEEYLMIEKNELLNIGQTLSLAGYEYMTSSSNSDDLGSYLYETNIKNLMEIKNCSTVKAQTIFLTLEGLRVMALTGILTEKIIDDVFKELIK